MINLMRFCYNRTNDKKIITINYKSYKIQNKREKFTLC